MCRIDGSEYSEKHSISRLIGAPPGYVEHDSGGQLTEYIRRKPYSVVLVDELEKASKEFVTIFLQVLDDGRLTDGQGRVVDFRNTVIIFTSNVESTSLAEMGQGAVPPQIKTAVMNAIRATWPPEFLNCIDSIIIYRALSHNNIRKIVEIRLAEVQQRIASKGMKLVLSEQAKEYLASIAYSPTYGAHPLQRVITTELLNLLSVHILDDRARDGELIKVEFDAQHNRLLIIPNYEGSRAADTMYLDDNRFLVEEMD
jgi:ATP-dependent Clp protease ATP-binding subunit ClpA